MDEVSFIEIIYFTLVHLKILSLIHIIKILACLCYFFAHGLQKFGLYSTTVYLTSD
jgi:hypothetical protein